MELCVIQTDYVTSETLRLQIVSSKSFRYYTYFIEKAKETLSKDCLGLFLGQLDFLIIFFFLIYNHIVAVQAKREFNQNYIKKKKKKKMKKKKVPIWVCN